MKKRKIHGKAFLLLPLALFLALQVNAKTIYSDYELIGTTEEYKEDTELIKYTPVVMHRFYTLKEVNEVFMPHYYESEETPYKDSYIYNRTRTLSNEKNPLAITYKRIAFKCSDCQNDIINKIKIINNNLLEEPVEANISVYGEDTIMHEAKTELSDEINIKLNYSTMVNTPRIIVEFDKDINLSLSIKYLYDTEVIYEQNLEPDDYLFGEKLVLEVKTDSDYEQYMTDKALLTLEEAQNSNYHKYYTNEVLTYRFYNLEKEFYEDSRENYLSGYEYDEKDDYIVYDIYERKILEEIEEKEELQEPEEPSKEETEEKEDISKEELEKDPENPLAKPEESKKEETEEEKDKPTDEEVIEKDPIKPVAKPEEPVNTPEDITTKPEGPKKEDNQEIPKDEINQDTIALPIPNDKSEIPPVLDNNQPIISEKQEPETKEPEISSNIQTEQTFVKENSKVETVKDIVYVLENDNSESEETDLDKELIEEKDKIETMPLVNEITEADEKKSDTNTSLVLKIMLRIIISILILFIIRQILCKVSANNAK